MVYTIGVLQPPNWDRRYTECFGFTLEDIYAEGFQSFETKMRTAGLPLEEIQYALPIPLELDQKARAERAIKLLEAGYAGEKNGPPARDHESMELLFDSIKRSARTDLAPRRDDDPVGLLGRRAVVRADRQRLDAAPRPGRARRRPT